MKSKPENSDPANPELTPEDVERVARQIAQKRGLGADEVTNNDYVEAKLQLSVENPANPSSSKPVISARATGQESASDLGEVPAKGGEQKKVIQNPEENTLAEKEIETGIDQADTEQRKENPEI